MINLQKIVSAMMMGALMLAGLSALALPKLAQAQAADSPLTPAQLGTVYGKFTGLGGTDVRVTIAKIIRVAMGLLGIVAVVIILIGGFTWMTAGGNDEKIAEAKKWIFAGIIGLAIILSAYAISNFVIDRLVNATTTDATTLPGL